MIGSARALPRVGGAGTVSGVRRVVAGVGCLLLLGACEPAEQSTGSVDPETAGRDLAPAAQAVLDSANSAFTDADLDQALVLYERVTTMAPDNPAGWFGVFMVHDARGDATAAQAALERARESAPRASLLRGSDSLPDGPDGG
jgi:hypothetical protein